MISLVNTTERRRSLKTAVLCGIVLGAIGAAGGTAARAQSYAGPSFREFSGVNQDSTSDTLFAGALVESGRLPLLRDGQLAGWLATLDEFRRLPVRHVVPGHGPVGDAGLIDDTRAYLLALDAEVRAHYARGDSLSETIAAVAMPRWRGLIGYADWHRANVQRAYQLLEERELADMPR